MHCDILSELQLIVENDKLSGISIVAEGLYRAVSKEQVNNRRQRFRERPTLAIGIHAIHCGGLPADPAPVRF